MEIVRIKSAVQFLMLPFTIITFDLAEKIVRATLEFPFLRDNKTVIKSCIEKFLIEVKVAS